MKVFERAFLEPNSIDAVAVSIDYDEDLGNFADKCFEGELTITNSEKSIVVGFYEYDSKEQFSNQVNKLRILQNALALIEKHMVEYAKVRYPELIEMPIAQEVGQEIEVTPEEEEYQQGLVGVDISDKVNEFPKL